MNTIMKNILILGLAISVCCTNSWAATAVPDIKANQSDDPITINYTDNLSISISLNSNDQNDNADWWLVGNTPTGLFSYQDLIGWQAGIVPMKQTALATLPQQEILNRTGLAPGSYTLYFGFDNNVNAEIDLDKAIYDTVNIVSTASTPSGVKGLDTSLFFYSSLAEDISIQNCTLSDGTETTCYKITIAGYPSNHEVGPFCPKTILDTADDSGIWFDGNGVYDLTGEFIVGLADHYNDSDWKLYDNDGNVNVTDTKEEFELAAVPDVDASLHNHCVEGHIKWLENGEPLPTTVLIPTSPVNGASATQANGNLGVTLNGVIIAHSAPVDAILSAHTIAAFDDCGGHINPFDGYHLHGARGCSEVGEAVDGETPIFAYALDGYPIHSPLDPADEAAAGLDACQGHTTEEHGYHYHAASVEKNAILSCFTGMTVESTRPDGRDDSDLAAAAEQLGVTEEALRAALGDPAQGAPDFAAAAEALGVTEAELMAALGNPPERAMPPEQSAPNTP